LVIITENEAVANDADMEEHLPGSPEEDEEEQAQEDQAEQESSEQERPVGVVSEAPVEDTATYAGRKQAALHHIAKLCGQRVVIERNRNESSEWTVVVELHPEDDDNEYDEHIGLKNISEVTRAQFDILLAHLFLLLTFRVSRRKRQYFFFVCHFYCFPFLLLLFTEMEG
jgi:hypothetical protein